jgi:hypothetical protein
VTHIEPIEDPASFAHHEPFPEITPEIANPCFVQVSRPSHRNSRRLRIVSATGMVLLVGGSASSMTVSGAWIDLSLAAALLGFVLILAARGRVGAQGRTNGVSSRRRLS